MATEPADGEEHEGAADPGEPQRIDKWLWFARVVKTRTAAAALVTAGKVRLNRQRIEKPSQVVKMGDVLTVAVHRQIKILKVLRAGLRRGPAPEARTLYEDLTPPPVPSAEGAVQGASRPAREPGAGRPTKRERRHMVRVRGGEGDE